MIAERLCFVLVQMLRNGVDDLVKAAVVARLAELLGYTDVKLQIVVHEDESRLKWTKFDGILVRFDEPATDSELVQAIVPHRFQKEYLVHLDELLYQPRSPDRKRLLREWNELSSLVTTGKTEEFAPAAERLVAWLLEYIKQRIDSV